MKRKIVKKIKEKQGIILITFLILILFFGYNIYQKYKIANPNLNYTLYQIKKKDLRQTINVDGKVLAEYEIKLASELPGIISKIYVKEGDIVRKGQLLAKIKDSDYRSQLNSAYANINLNRASYEKTKNPNQNLDLDLEIAENNKELTLDNIAKTENDIKSNIDNLNIFLDQNLRMEIDDYFAHEEVYPVLNHRISNEKQANSLEKERYELGIEFSKYLKIKNPDINDAIKIIIIFEKMSRNLYSASPGFLGFSDTQVEAKENRLSQLKENITERKNNLLALKNKLEGLNSQLSNNKIIKEKTKNIVSENDLRIAEGKIKIAQTSIDNAYLQLQKTYIRAPRNGIITNLYKNDGEYITPSEPLIKLNSRDIYFEIKVPEIDIPNVSLGMKAEIKLNAFKEQKISAKTWIIYPEVEEIFGVKYYKTKLLFTERERNKNIFPGMTGEAYLILKEQKNAWSIKRDLVEKDDKGYFVNIINPQKENIFDNLYTKKYFKSNFIGDDYIEINKEDFRGLKITEFN